MKGISWLMGILKFARTKRFLDLYSDYEEYHSELDTGILKRVSTFIAWIDEGSTVLDVGCGDGFVASYIVEKRRASVIGLDVSEVAAKKARKKGIIVQICDLNKILPDVEGEYDYIVISEVIEHLIRPHETLKFFLSRAKKGVIITIPNSGWLGYRLQYLLGHFPRQSFTHLHYWTHKDFYIFCETLKIEILDFKAPVDEGILARVFPNLFAYSLCYLLKPSKG